MAKFAFVVDGEVGFVLNLNVEGVGSEIAERNTACLRSNPEIVEIPEGTVASSGWKYDETGFRP